MGLYRDNRTNYQLLIGVIIAIFIGSAAAGAAGGLTSYQTSGNNAGASTAPASIERLYTNNANQSPGELSSPSQSGQPSGVPAGVYDPSQIVFPSPEPAPSPVPSPIEVKPISRCPYIPLSEMPCTYYCPDAANLSPSSICHPCNPGSMTQVVCVDGQEVF